MRTGERRRKWAVLNVTPTERAEITAAAKAEGLSINAFILARIGGRSYANIMHQAAAVRHLARIEDHLDQIARQVRMGTRRPEAIAQVLLVLWRIEQAVQVSCSTQRRGGFVGNPQEIDDNMSVEGTPC